MTRERESRLVYSTGGDRTEEPLQEETLPRRAERVCLMLERRASGRLVTVVTGLPGSAAEAASLGRALRSTCGTGGTFKSGRLELQGDHRDRVEQALIARGMRPKRAGG